MIQIQLPPGQRLLELGGGDNRNPRTDVNVDVRPSPAVDFVVDLGTFPWPIRDQDFDAVLCCYCLEHIPWRQTQAFLQETLRVLKPGGSAFFVVPNTAAQVQWIKDHPEGWDGKDLFSSASEVLFGSQDYPDNSHRGFFTPELLLGLFSAAGFCNVLVAPFGERQTDLTARASRPVPAEPGPQPAIPPEEQKQEEPQLNLTREEMFNKDYFCGGGRVGGYAREGMWDFPQHEITARHVLTRRPESVLEVGCARGYIGKRLQDAGVRWAGLEISRHCFLTRVCEGILPHDLCKTPWPDAGPAFDLCFSTATLEHVPEEFLPAVITEMQLTCKRGLHGVDFGEHDDGFDKTHVTLKPRDWWVETFARLAPGWPVEILDKEELERGQLPMEVLTGDGRVKVNLGSFMSMFHHGWTNIDALDLGQWAGAYGYRFHRQDVRQGLPFDTGTVDLIFLSHLLEHLTHREALSLLRDCRRALKPTGALRIITPDAELLTGASHNVHCGKPALAEFDEIDDACAAAPTSAGKLWMLLCEGRRSCWDMETLTRVLGEAGFTPLPASFRHAGDELEDATTLDQRQSLRQILRETLDLHPALSLYCSAVPRLG